MAQILTKNEKIIISSLVVCVVGLGSFFKQFSLSKKSYDSSVESLVNYKMGKAEDQAALYDLNGRQIHREYTSEEDMELNKERSVAKAQVDAKNNAKKENKKSTPPKFAFTEKAKTDAAKKAKEIELLKQMNSPKTSALDNQLEGTHVNTMSNTQLIPQQNIAEQDLSLPKETELKKTFAQLRQEFYTLATKEVVVSIVSAYKKNEITKEDFYKLQTEALSQQDSKYVGLALYALRLTPSAESFSLLTQYQPTTTPAFQDYIQSALVAYNQSQNLPILKVVLQAKQKIVVMKALDIIKYGLTEIKNGNISSLVDSRSKRDTQFTGYSITNYSTLVSVINQVIQAGLSDGETLTSLESVKNLINESNTQVAIN